MCTLFTNCQLNLEFLANKLIPDEHKHHETPKLQVLIGLGNTEIESKTSPRPREFCSFKYSEQ